MNIWRTVELVRRERGSCAVLVPVDTNPDDKDERIKVSELFAYADRVVVLLASSWELPQGTLLNTCTTPSLARSLTHTHTHAHTADMHIGLPVFLQKRE